MSTKLNAIDTLKAAGYGSDSKRDNDTFLKTQLGGSRLVLQGAGIDSKALGMSDVNTLVVAKGILATKKAASIIEQKKVAIDQKEYIARNFTRFVKELPGKQDLAVEACGISPSGTLGTYVQDLADGRKLSFTVKALRLFPDDEKLKTLKTAKSLMAEKIGVVASESNIKKTINLLEFEAGTKDAKSISILDTDTKKPDCIQDDEFKYQVSISLFPEIVKC